MVSGTSGNSFIRMPEKAQDRAVDRSPHPPFTGGGGSKGSGAKKLESEGTAAKGGIWNSQEVFYQLTSSYLKTFSVGVVPLFFFCLLLICGGVGRDLAFELGLGSPGFTAAQGSCLAVLVLDAQALLLRREKQDLQFLAISMKILALLTTMATDLGYGYIESGDAVVSLTRFTYLLFWVPSMLACCCFCTDSTHQDFLRLTGFGLGSVCTAFFALILPIGFGLPLLGAAFACYFSMALRLRKIFRGFWPASAPGATSCFQEILLLPWVLVPLAWFACFMEWSYLEGCLFQLSDLALNTAATVILLIGGEKGLKVRLKQVENSLLQKDSSMAHICHDLRTPLNGIVGLVEAMLIGTFGDISEKAKERLQVVKISGQRLSNLVNDILDSSALLHGSLRLVEKAVNLPDICQEVIELSTPLCKKGVELKLDIAEDVTILWGDGARIKQVLHNIIGNAVKFTTKGHVLLKVEYDHAITVMPILIITLSDTGPGIPEEKLCRIWDAFDQGHESTAKEYGGTGLGLTISKNLIQAHGGDIDVTSEVGTGTTFTIRLPCRTNPNVVPDATTPDLFQRMLFQPRSTAGVTTSKSAKDLGAMVDSAGEEVQSAPLPSRPRERRQSMPIISACPAHRSAVSECGSDHKTGTTQHGLPLLTRSSPSARHPDSFSRTSSLATRSEFQKSFQRVYSAEKLASKLKPSHFEVCDGRLEVFSVDDDPVNQMVIEGLLEPKGFVVTPAMNGQEALELLANRDYLPDIVLLDCQMPVKNGFDVCMELRIEYPDSLPIIMISANTNEEDIIRGFRMGSNDYVKKPFNRHEVLARIETQIKLSHMWKTEVEAVRSNELLAKILPFHVADRLKEGDTLVADSHDQVTILFSDVVGFTKLAASIHTSDLIMVLNNMFTRFDRLVDKHGVYKVETIGDAYMVAAGHEELSREDHCQRVFEMARDMIEAAKEVELPDGSRNLRIRIGIHSGPAYAGVVGVKCPRYCFFGDTVNTASRMESNGFPMCIHASEQTKQQLSDKAKWVEYGTRQIKGKGSMTTYLAEVGDWEQALRNKEREKEQAIQQEQASREANGGVDMEMPGTPSHSEVSQLVRVNSWMNPHLQISWDGSPMFKCGIDSPPTQGQTPTAAHAPSIEFPPAQPNSDSKITEDELKLAQQRIQEMAKRSQEKTEEEAKKAQEELQRQLEQEQQEKRERDHMIKDLTRRLHEAENRSGPRPQGASPAPDASLRSMPITASVMESWTSVANSPGSTGTNGQFKPSIFDSSESVFSNGIGHDSRDGSNAHHPSSFISSSQVPIGLSKTPSYRSLAPEEPQTASLEALLAKLVVALLRNREEMEVAVLLRRLGLEMYLPVLIKGEVTTISTIVRLGEEGLLELGIAARHPRKVILDTAKGIAALMNSAVASSPVVSPCHGRSPNWASPMLSAVHRNNMGSRGSIRRDSQTGAFTRQNQT